MEVKGGWENKGYVLLFEMIGTANLLYAINSSAGNNGGSWLPFAVGLTIFGTFVFLERLRVATSIQLSPLEYSLLREAKIWEETLSLQS